MTLPTLAEATAQHLTRGALAEQVYGSQTYDMALPQDWVDHIGCSFNGGACAFVWLYPKGSVFGQPAPLYREAAEWLNDETVGVV